MSEIAVVTQKQDERRKHERVGVPQNAVIAQDKKGRLLGMVRQLGRGGMLIEGDPSALKKGKNYTVTIVDDTEAIKRKVDLVVRYTDDRHIGCEFEDLDVDAAVELGILIGKYYSGQSKV
jgi:hypothetical protein